VRAAILESLLHIEFQANNLGCKVPTLHQQHVDYMIRIHISRNKEDSFFMYSQLSKIIKCLLHQGP